ncbi:MAG: hypothetical protein ABII79_06060 [bacterium]
MKKKSIGYYMIASAIVWGAVILGCSFKLKGTACYDDIRLILSGGAGFHLLFIWVPLASQFRKNKEEQSEMDHSNS